MFKKQLENMNLQSLKETNISIGVFQVPPEVFISQDKDGKFIYDGLMADVFKTLAEIMGFHVNYVHETNEIFGTLLDNGSWVGVIAQLIKKEVDIAGLGLFLHRKRLEVVDYSTSALFHENMVIVLQRQDTIEEFSITSYIKPFSILAWFLIFIIWLVLCCSSALIKNIQNISFIKVTLCKGYLLQAYDYRNSGRMFTLLRFWFYILLMTFYNSNLMASLTVSKFANSFKTVEDLLDDGGYAFCMRPGSLYYSWINKSHTAIYNRLWEKVISSDLFNISNDEEGIELAAKNPKIAFVIEDIYAQNKIKNKCNLVLLPEKHFASGAHLTFVKHSNLREIFSQYIHRLRTSGVLNKLSQLHWPKKRYYCQDEVLATAYRPLSLVMVLGCFILLSLGISTSLIALGIERLIWKQQISVFI